MFTLNPRATRRHLLGVVFLTFDPEIPGDRRSLLSAAKVLLPELKEHSGQRYFNGNIAVPAFSDYTQRVRKIVLPVISITYKFSGQLFTRLAKELAGQPLLPGLRHVVVEDLDDMASSFLQLLLTPALISLTIRGNGYALSRQHSYQSLFPCLKNDAPEHSIANLWLKTLQSLDFCFPGTPVAPGFVSDIATWLPQLTHLKLDINFTHPNNACAVRDGAKDRFPSIRTLHLVIRPSSKTCHLDALRFCSFWSTTFLSMLTSLTIPLSGYCSTLSELIQSLSQAHHFRRIELTQAKGQKNAEISVAALSQLVAIRTLEELIVDVERVIEDCSWPKSALRFINAAFSDPARTAVLRTLILPVNASYPLGLKELKAISQESDRSRKARQIISSSTLRILDSKIFTLMEHSTIGQYLDRVAPNLQSLKESWAFIDHLRQKEKLIRASLSYLREKDAWVASFFAFRRQDFICRCRPIGFHRTMELTQTKG
ncbi:hypothetical protein BKA70DRAFT_1307687 [Coprinopsis sp. MPI-PUGE-AT-0042]|nr:hypothetical protein BKA70DRAFT_1307687 [Coprinopsis sp. MPI-PUGE-AT-0042]